MEWRMTLLNEREKGREEGREEGRAEGKEEGTLLNQIDLIIKKMKRGLDFATIAEQLEVEEENIRPIYDVVKASAPEYDTDQILQNLRG